jgi:hypothetical protein
MSYPQPLASQEVLDGQDLFRLFTPLQSGADAYELDVSGSAFAIGPQSDLSAARVTYVDSSQPSRVSSFVVSVGDPFVGRVDAFASLAYQKSNAPGRIIVTPENLYNANWFPTVNGLDIVSYIRPKLDLVSYFAPPSSIPLKRADFTTRGRLSIADQGGGSGVTWILVPFYGRKLASIEIRNKTAGSVALTLAAAGINFTQDGVTPYGLTDFVVAQTAISLAGGGAIAAVNSGVTAFQITAAQNGIFDYLMLSFAGATLNSSASEDAVRYIINTTDDAE